MLSIRTNLTSLLAQNSLRTSSNKLNQAIERMTTGFKINNAKDNAANYSISTNLSTKIGAYQVAEENTAMGLDMVTTASETLSLIEDKLSRLRALQEQASNGTYGDQSLQAINQEVNAIMDEIERLYGTTQYNGINLFEGDNKIPESMPKINPETGFIAEVVEQTPDVVVSDPTQLASAITGNTIIGISNAETLAELATIVNNGNTCSGKTIVLTNDIDLADWCEAHKADGGWVPIGNSATVGGTLCEFIGTFNGNGYTISNLNINRSGDFQGFFGQSYRASIKNLVLKNVEITVDGRYVGALIGHLSKSEVSNCYSTGSVTGTTHTGGLVGETYMCSVGLTDCYSTVDVSGSLKIGGLVGQNHTSAITNSYSAGNVSGDDMVGGLVGTDAGSGVTVSNSYTTSKVSGVTQLTGAFMGFNNCTTFTNCSYNSSINPFSTAIGGEVVVPSNLNDLFNPIDISMQIGINSDSSSSLNLQTSLTLLSNVNLRGIGLNNTLDYLSAIDEYLTVVMAKQTEFGAVENRLTSAMEEIGIKYENLVSTRSTIRDADISEVSSSYIQQQILQQASSTLLATANQSPDLALRLIMNSTI